CAKLVATGAIDVDVVRFCILGLTALVVRAVGGVIAAHGQARLSSDVGAALRLRILDGWFQCNPLRRARQTDHGDERGVFSLTDGIRAIETGWGKGVLGVLRSSLQIVPLIALLGWLEPRLASIVVVALGIFSFIVRGIRRQLSRA